MRESRESFHPINPGSDIVYSFYLLSLAPFLLRRNEEFVPTRERGNEMKERGEEIVK